MLLTDRQTGKRHTHPDGFNVALDKSCNIKRQLLLRDWFSAAFVIRRRCLVAVFIRASTSQQSKVLPALRALDRGTRKGGKVWSHP